MSRSSAGSFRSGSPPPNISLDVLRDDLGLTPQELASALGVSPRTIGRWRTGELVAPPGETGKRLEELWLVHERLFETVREDAVPEWLNTRRSFLGNLTPTEVIRAGRADRVLELLTVIDHGIYV